MRYLPLLLLATFSFTADPPTEKALPIDIQKEVEARDAEVARAKALFDAAVAKATAAATKKLEAVQKDKTKKGDLEGALAAKGVIDKWAADTPDLLGAPKATGANGPSDFVGKWKMTISRPNGSVSVYPAELLKGGVANDNRGATPALGSWFIQKDKLIINWSSGAIHTYDVNTLTGADSVGNKVALEK